jgi:hypothetical protein
MRMHSRLMVEITTFLTSEPRRIIQRHAVAAAHSAGRLSSPTSPIRPSIPQFVKQVIGRHLR